MRRLAIPIALLLPGLAGCGGGVSSSTLAALPSVAGTHGGMAFPLTDGKGYVEVVVEPVKATKTTREVVLALYFLKPGLKMAVEPAPVGVAATVTVPGEPSPVKATFSSKPLSQGDGRFATEVGPYDFDDIRGEVSGTLEGQPFHVPIAVR